MKLHKRAPETDGVEEKGEMTRMPEMNVEGNLPVSCLADIVPRCNLYLIKIVHYLDNSLRKYN